MDWNQCLRSTVAFLTQPSFFSSFPECLWGKGQVVFGNWCLHTTPPPLVLTQWLRGQKCGNTGLPCLDKPVLPCGTYHGTHVAGCEMGIVSDNRPAYTPGHKKKNYSHPSCSLHKATKHILDWMGTEPIVPKKAQKWGNTGSPWCLDRGGGGHDVLQVKLHKILWCWEQAAINYRTSCDVRGWQACPAHLTPSAPSFFVRSWPSGDHVGTQEEGAEGTG